MPNKTLTKEERARLRETNKTMGRTDLFDMPSPPPEEPVLLETIFGRVTKEEFDRRSKNFEKNMEEGIEASKIKKYKTGGVIKPRGYGIARGGRACKLS